MGIQSAEHACACGELESIPHILCHCVLREDIRYILRDSCASLGEKVLLGTFEGLTAVAKLISKNSKATVSSEPFWGVRLTLKSTCCRFERKCSPTSPAERIFGVADWIYLLIAF
jgi:hypothetical protein